MTFPSTPLPVRVDLDLGTWTDITDDVLVRDQIVITRGRGDETGQTPPSTCTLTLNNRAGAYSPRNPAGAHYGALGRNTPIRVSLVDTVTHLRLPAATGSYASCPDSAGVSVTGDLDVRLDATLEDWGSAADLAGKYANTAGQHSWALFVSDQRLWLRWSTDGTTTLEQASTALLPVPGARRQAVRATLDVNNGAGGHVVTFYTATTAAGPWTQLGDAVTGSGTTSVRDSTSPVIVGAVRPGSTVLARGKVHTFQLRNGIGGTVVASPDFTAQTAGATSFADAQGNTWTISGDAELSDLDVRFHGEVASWPQRWDTSGRDVWVPIEAAGILRRLQQGAAPLASTMRHGIGGLDSLVGYWPCEDGTDATELASGISGHPAAQLRGTPQPGAYTGFACSNPVLLGDAEVSASVPAYTDTEQWQVRFLLAVPAAGLTNGEILLQAFCRGSATEWRLTYGTGGTITITARDSEGSVLGTSGPWAYSLNGGLWRLSLEIARNGTGVDWDLAALEVGDTTGVSTGGTLASNTMGRITRVVVNPGGGLGSDMAVGHIAVTDTWTSLYDLADELNAYRGETSGTRINRLCDLAGVDSAVISADRGGTTLGAQRPQTLVDLLREVETANGGLLHEPRDRLGLRYVSRRALYTREPCLALDYNDPGIAAMDPVDDDQATRNDVTVTRTGGASARAALETGALSVLAPPSGVGRYDEDVEINVSGDLYLPMQAAWRLHLGTVDEARYPVVALNLASGGFTADAALTAAARELDIGDRLTIDNPPAWLPPDAITQMVHGLRETLGVFDHDIEVSCAPESPWHVATYSTARYGSATATLASGVTSSATSLSVATTGLPWTTSSGSMPFDIRVGGEVMTVTAVSGTSSPQTFTVTRSVNGVTKAHSAGAPLALADPTVHGL